MMMVVAMVAMTFMVFTMVVMGRANGDGSLDDVKPIAMATVMAVSKRTI